jgi:hypothetical protein
MIFPGSGAYSGVPGPLCGSDAEDVTLRLLSSDRHARHTRGHLLEQLGPPAVRYKGTGLRALVAPRTPDAAFSGDHPANMERAESR